MSNAKVAVFGGVASLLLTGFGYYITYIYACEYSVSCYNLIFHTAHPMLYGGSALAVVFALLYVFPQAFNAWKKFAIWFVPLAALLFIFYPDPGSGDLLSPMPEQFFQWVSVLYVIISSVIIGLDLRK